MQSRRILPCGDSSRPILDCLQDNYNLKSSHGHVVDTGSADCGTAKLLADLRNNNRKKTARPKHA